MKVRLIYVPGGTVHVCHKHWRNPPEGFPAMGEVLDARRRPSCVVCSGEWAALQKAEAEAEAEAKSEVAK